jgi:DNA ligase-1
MLAHALDEAELPKLEPGDYAAEWKWDGIRVQAASERGVRRLYSRTGDDISGAFPDILDCLNFEGAIDGELLVARDAEGSVAVAPFADLQQRLNRKTVSSKLIRSHPAFIRAYDLLQDGDEDIRPLSFRERRERLEDFVARAASPRIDVSPLVSFASWEELARLRAEPPDAREVQRAINQVEASFYRGMERVGGYGGKADQLNAYFMMVGTPDYFANDLARYTSLTPAAVQAAVRDWLPAERRVELIVEPEAER